MRFEWPDLYFGPINLWTAPWLGRRYEEFVRRQAAPRQAAPVIPTARVEQIKTLTQHR